MKRNSKIVSILLLSIQALIGRTPIQLNYVDTLPLYSPMYPYDFLNTEAKARYAGDLTRNISERVQFSFNLFMETTNYANTLSGDRVFAADVHGRIGLLAMCYGSVPAGQTESALVTAIGNTAFTTPGITGNMDSTAFADPNQQFGFLKNPSTYRKLGVRGFGAFRILENLTVYMYGGFCDMRQSMTGLEDQTPYATYTSIGGTSAGSGSSSFATDQSKVQQGLTRQWQNVLTQIGVDYNNWQAMSIEDPTVQITYRQNFPIQQEDEDHVWTKFVIIPHLTAGVTAGFAESQNPNILLSLPFGNNGHTAFTLSVGLAMSFNDTIEIFADGEINQYNTLTKLMRVPTSAYQYGLFPYATKVKVSPANVYRGTFGLNAHYFIDRLSGYVQVAYAHHSEDSYQLVNYDSAYNLLRLKQDSEWKYGAVNIGLNYDLSPNVSLGGAAQFPMNRRGAYLTNTFLIGMTATF